MKAYQITFVSKENFEDRLTKILNENQSIPQERIFFFIRWTDDRNAELKTISRCLESIFPDSLYYGSEAAGNIVNGILSYGINITCFIFEDEDSKTELLWVENGTELGSLADLWKCLREKKGLRAVELIPSVTYVGALEMDNSIIEIDDDIVIFGGASVNHNNTRFEASIFAKGHDITENGMAVVLYYGRNLNMSSDYVLGWKGLGSNMRVTKSNGCIISEIDNKPAFSIYEKYLGLNLADDDNLVFPLIVEEDGVEYIRTPQKFLPDKALRMFVNIDEGLNVRIAYGDKNTILASLYDKMSEIAEFKPQVLRAYSCTARKLFWGDEDAARETVPLQSIAPISGFYTGGEIIRVKNKLRVLNSTLVTICCREGDGSNQSVRQVTDYEMNDKSLISRITHFVEVVSDEQQKALNLANEEKIRNDQQQQELQKALESADSANKAKTQFLFNMSHDIRTPMNAILGFTALAIKHIDDKGKTLDCLNKTQQSGDLLLDLINDVLEVSRIEAGKAEIDLKPGDIYYGFSGIESTMRVVAEAKDINLTYEFGNVEDRFVLCDVTRTERVFVNIISNAIKYTNEGGFVKVYCEQISKKENGRALYKYVFEDNGIGMSEEFQKHIFEQFSREKTVTKTGIQGTGLGMAVCKSYVDLMGGTIECKSELGKGTTITVVLPFEIQKEKMYVDPVTKELVRSSGERDRKNIIDFKGLKVLLTEDNELNREIAVEILEEKGLIVEEAEDGTEAVKILKEKGPHYFDAILMDIQMPIMGGYEATKKIREMYPNERIPIIAISANAFEEDKAASKAAGMDGHVAKPIKTDELFGVMACFI